MENIKCPLCSFVRSNHISVSIHTKRTHGIEMKNYYMKYVAKIDDESLCACGCGQVPKFHNVRIGYSKYILGHSSRIKNNWGHNQKAHENSGKTRKLMFESGELIAWVQGLTKYTDERIKNLGEKGSQTIRNDQAKIKKRSDNMKKLWKEKTITPLAGKNHPAWQGGTSAIQAHVRSNLQSVWNKPKLISSGFKCEVCMSGKHLEVHHNDERFATILKKAIKEIGEPETYEIKEKITKWVIDYHVENKVQGKVLCENCHLKEHEKEK